MRRTRPSPEQSAERVVERAFGVKDRKMRTAILGEFCNRLPAEELLPALRVIIARAEKKLSRYQEAYLSLIDSEFLLGFLEAGKAEEIRERAREEGDSEILRLFTLTDPRAEQGITGDLEIPPGLEYLTLGERKSLARGKRTLLWEKMLFDPDPRVIRNILLNPKITEADVIRIVSRRPCPGGVLRAVFDNPRWIKRYRVKRTLVFNPYTPEEVGRKLLGFLLQPDLEEVIQDGGLSHLLRETAAVLSEKRKKGRIETEED